MEIQTEADAAREAFLKWHEWLTSFEEQVACDRYENERERRHAVHGLESLRSNCKEVDEAYQRFCGSLEREATLTYSLRRIIKKVSGVREEFPA